MASPARRSRSRAPSVARYGDFRWSVSSIPASETIGQASLDERQDLILIDIVLNISLFLGDPSLKCGVVRERATPGVQVHVRFRAKSCAGNQTEADVSAARELIVESQAQKWRRALKLNLAADVADLRRREGLVAEPGRAGGSCVQFHVAITEVSSGRYKKDASGQVPVQEKRR